LLGGGAEEYQNQDGSLPMPVLSWHSGDLGGRIGDETLISRSLVPGEGALVAGADQTAKQP